MDARLKEIIATCCRYYKGEPVCPGFDDPAKAALWEFEKHWMELGISGQTDALQQRIGEYLKADPAGASSGDDIPPISLKALIYHHFSKSSRDQAEAVAIFRRLIAKYYRITT